MDLYWNLNGNAISQTIDVSGHEVAPITVGGGMDEPIRVKTHRDGTPEKEPVGSTWFLGVKIATQYADGAHLATIAGADWTVAATAADFTTGTLITDTVPIRAALHVDGNDANDLGEIATTNAQLYFWPPGADRPVRSQIFHFRIAGWVSSGDETDPVEADPAYPDPSTLVSRSYLTSVVGFRQAGSVAIPASQSYVDVTFDTPFDDDTWELQGLIVRKTSGTPGNLFPGLMSAKSAAGFTVQLNGNTDTTGYALDYVANTTSTGGLGLFDGNAASLISGTIPDARFPATLPAVSGVNLTALNASALGSGTVPDARFPAALPAVSGANLTALPADTGWTANDDAGSKTAVIPSAADIATALLAADPAVTAILSAVAAKVKALETTLASSKVPNA